MKVPLHRRALHRHTLGLPLVLFVAVLLFFYRAWREGMFADGLVYAALGRNAAEDGRWLVPHLSPDLLAKFFDHPPLFFLYEGALFELFGVSWTVARLAVLPFALGLVVLLWREVARELGRRTALVAAGALVITVPFLRWSRFPNLDIPMAFFAALALFQGRRAALSGSRARWLLCGVFFGLALLIKGFFAAFVPPALLLYLAFSGRLRRLATPWPWLGFLLGLLIFGLWPLALATQGEWSGFEQYVRSGFEKSGAAVRETRFLETLLTRVTLPLVLALVGLVVLIRRKDRDHVGWLGLAWVLAVCVPLLLRGVRYSHWLLAMYPGLAILAGIGGIHAPRIVRRAIVRVAWPTAALAALALACLPLAAVEGRRDAEVFDFIDVTNRLAQRPDGIYLVNECAPRGAFVAAVEFAGRAPAGLRSWNDAGDAGASDGSGAYLAPLAWFEALDRDARRRFDERYRILVRYPERGWIGVVDARLVENGLFESPGG